MFWGPRMILDTLWKILFSKKQSGFFTTPIWQKTILFPIFFWTPFLRNAEFPQGGILVINLLSPFKLQPALQVSCMRVEGPPPPSELNFLHHSWQLLTLFFLASQGSLYVKIDLGASSSTQQQLFDIFTQTKPQSVAQRATKVAPNQHTMHVREAVRIKKSQNCRPFLYPP